MVFGDFGSIAIAPTDCTESLSKMGLKVVARPGLSSADPNGLWRFRINRNRADRLHRLLVKDGLEGCCASRPLRCRPKWSLAISDQSQSRRPTAPAPCQRWA